MTVESEKKNISLKLHLYINTQWGLHFISGHKQCCILHHCS